jgi:hypothetical protein
MRLFYILFLVPLLLAPVRVQQGADVLLLQPSTAPTGARGSVAVALPSPTVIEVSPTRAPFISASISASLPADASNQAAEAPAPSAKPQPAQPQAVPARGMTPQQAALCVRALTMVNDLSVASMKQSGRENLVDLTIAVAIAQVQAAQGTWPMLQPIVQAPLPWFAPYRAELKKALEYTEGFCRNPNAAAPRQGLSRPR